MSVYTKLAERAVARLPGVGAEERTEIASSLRELAEERPRDRWRELGSLAWLRVRLQSRVETEDREDTTWRQGLHRGGALLLAACFVELAGAAGTGDIGPTLAEQPLGLRAVVGLGALVAGTVPPRGAAGMCPWRWAALMAIGGAVAATGRTSSDVVVVLLTLGLPLVWLASSRADPRFAVGAAVALFWRLVALDFHELGSAVVALPTDHELDLLLLRWTVMVAGVLAAVAVARDSIRRASAPLT